MKKSSKEDNALRFTVSLPEDLKIPFLEECERERRDMVNQIRYILQSRYEKLQEERDWEEFRKLRKSRPESPPHFSGEPPAEAQESTA